MGQSFPNGVPDEDGETFFGDSSDNLSTGNVGGSSRDGGSFTPNLTPPPGPLGYMFGSDETAVGVFHTHPYSNDSLSMTFSGDDVAYQIDNGLNFSVVESDDGNQWLLLRTQQTPSGGVDADATEQEVENETSDARSNAQQDPAGYEAAQLNAITGLASKYHMVLYKGTNGVFTRVN